jgi:hypothetical protein
VVNPNPTDANTYNPNTTSAVAGTTFPRWMYHPTNPAQIVPDQASQDALVAADPLWTTVDPNATT